MSAPHRVNRSLRLEFLETRTLLAADPFGLMADFDLSVKALSATGEFDASFSTNFGNTQLVLKGGGAGDLTINLDLLPAFVTNLKLSSFATVNFIGTDHVANLIATDIKAIHGSNLSVTTSLHLNNVASVDLASAGTMAVLKGSDTSLNVRSLNDTMIVSDLHTLTIDSESRTLFVVGLNSEQSLNLKYRPETVSLAGLTADAVHLIDKLALPTPGETAPTENSGSTGSDSAPVTTPTPVVVVTLPLDERTRTFIAELRDLLRSSGNDSQQAVFEFMAHNALTGGQPVAPAGAKAHLADAMPRELEMLGRDLLAFHRSDRINLDGPRSEVREGLVADANAAPAFRHVQEPGVVDPAQTSLPGGRLNFDATWPVVREHGPAREPIAFTPPTLRPDSENEEMNLNQTVRALGSYLVDRVSAEFSPGQQSLILLVDPKPSRGAGSNPTTALEQFSRSTRTSLSNLREVMS